jgi:hypothetical protein
MKHRWPIMEPCSAHDMFAKLTEMNIGRTESNANVESILLPRNLALATEGGTSLWGCIMHVKAPLGGGYVLARPTRTFQRQQQRRLNWRNYLVLVKVPPDAVTTEVQP